MPTLGFSVGLVTGPGVVFVVSSWALALTSLSSEEGPGAGSLRKVGSEMRGGVLTVLASGPLGVVYGA